jgi:hypothetical protein
VGATPWRFESSQPHYSAMHAAERVHAALALVGRGLSASEISRETGVPRSTIREWLTLGPPPRTSRLGQTCSACGTQHRAHEQLPAEYTYLLGLYLGDGCISSHPRSVFRLRITLDAKYPAIVAECRSAVAAVAPGNRVLRQPRADNSIEVSAYSKGWPCLFPQHGPGKKHERPILLHDWQRTHVGRAPGLLLRGLIHSDGSRFMNTGRGGWRHPRYTFCNVSTDIQDIFCHACDLLGLRWTVAPPKTVYVSRKADVARLDEFVGPKR